MKVDALDYVYSLIITGCLTVALYISIIFAPDNYWQQEAIKHHAACRIVNPDGSTTFQWNDEKQK